MECSTNGASKRVVRSGKSEITTVFRPAQEMQQPQMQTSSSGEAKNMTEDLFVMTAGGGLVRHRLTYMHSAGATEPGLANGDRWATVLHY